MDNSALATMNELYDALDELETGYMTQRSHRESSYQWVRAQLEQCSRDHKAAKSEKLRMLMDLIARSENVMNAVRAMRSGNHSGQWTHAMEVLIDNPARSASFLQSDGAMQHGFREGPERSRESYMAMTAQAKQRRQALQEQLNQLQSVAENYMANMRISSQMTNVVNNTVHHLHNNQWTHSNVPRQQSQFTEDHQLQQSTTQGRSPVDVQDFTETTQHNANFNATTRR